MATLSKFWGKCESVNFELKTQDHWIQNYHSIILSKTITIKYPYLGQNQASPVVAIRVCKNPFGVLLQHMEKKIQKINAYQIDQNLVLIIFFFEHGEHPLQECS